MIASEAPPLRPLILIAASDGLFRDGVRSLVEGEWPFSTVTEASTCLDADDCVSRQCPDLLILDLAIPDFPDPARLQRLASRVEMVILFSDVDLPHFAYARRLGITAHVDKRSGATAFLDAIRPVLGDRRSGMVANHAPSLRPASLPVDRSRPLRLTRREREVLAEVAAAHPNKKIASRLGISEDTVKRHVNAIFGKLGVSNRVELTLFAAQRGLISSVPQRRSTYPAALATSA